MKNIWIVFFAFFVFNIAAAQVEQRTDFLIIENPAELLIYNKYQQSVQLKDKLKFISYIPLQILNEDELLSDQITPALKFKLQNEIYFLIKDNQGKIINRDSNGYNKIFKNCAIINDTVQILADRAVLISQTPAWQPSSKNKRFYLKKDDYLLRLFKKKNAYYVLKLGNDVQYGWCQFRKNRSWRILEKDADGKNKLIPPYIREKITARIESANQTYSDYFKYFNQRLNRQKEIPRWVMEIEDNQIKCNLENDFYMQKLTESARYLIHDLENILLGTNIALNYENGVIIIQVKNNK